VFPESVPLLLLLRERAAKYRHKSEEERQTERERGGEGSRRGTDGSIFPGFFPMRVARRTCASCTCSPNIIALYARERAGSENVDIRRSGSRFEEATWKSAAEMVELPLEARCVTFSNSRRHNRGSIPIERRAKLTLGQVAAERKVGSRVTARSNLARKIYVGFLGRPRVVWGKSGINGSRCARA